MSKCRESFAPSAMHATRATASSLVCLAAAIEPWWVRLREHPWFGGCGLVNENSVTDKLVPIWFVGGRDVSRAVPLRTMSIMHEQAFAIQWGVI